MFNFKKRQRKVIINNEEVTEVKVQDENIDLKRDYINNILKTKKLPIVLLDPLWHSAKEHIKSSVIDKVEKELQELLKEQARLNTDYKEYTVIKQNFLKEILILSERVQVGNNDEALKELNKMHQSILVTNQKLEEIEKRLDSIEDEINDKNKVMISEMIAVGYGYIEMCKQKSRTLEDEIATLRMQMLQKTAQKKESEAFLKDIYNYIHSIVGREQIEVIDKALGEKK
ncbi:MAG: hypothetical protein H9872_02050 [Candidatus Cellulosilyticum pullistercoris]|uniref:Uncharacterized protein n=1 Tax=Candidatus Cellulosilyticum pullistercoris TaxID=2838521 RepID=A0A9E2KB50_9FIRM|nr:hypothetical protein [Candidatus Cellulosilyticum pullistercoris]